MGCDELLDTVYSGETDGIIVFGSSTECPAAKGITIESFRVFVRKVRAGRIKGYSVIIEDDEIERRDIVTDDTEYQTVSDMNA